MIWLHRLSFAAIFVATGHIGIWGQAEPLMAILLLLAALALCANGKISVLPGMLALGTILLLPFTQFPLLSWLGEPATEIGGAWWLVVAVLATLPQDRWSMPIAGACALALLLTPWDLNRWPDFMAMLGLAIICREKHIAALLIGLACIWFSQNWTAILATPVALLAAAFWPQKLRGTLPLLAAGTAAAAVCFAPLASLHSRAMLWEALAPALPHPHGWGMANDLILGVKVSDPHWEGLGAGSLVAHNGYLEVTLALGLGGLLLYCAIWALGAVKAENWIALGAWTAYAIVVACWFEVPPVVPFFAAMLAGLPTVRMSGWLRAPIVGLLLLSSASIGLTIWSGQVSLDSVNSGGDVVDIWEPMSGSPLLWWLMWSVRADGGAGGKTGLELYILARHRADTHNASKRLVSIMEGGL